MCALKIIGAAVAALILITSAGSASTKEHESTGQYFDDSVITTKVRSAIMADDSLKVSDINVETFKRFHKCLLPRRRRSAVDRNVR